jgi:hypothetical protein
MVWLVRLSQAKPMALPFSREITPGPHGGLTGIERIDAFMTEETAKREKEKRSPKYLDSGASGVVVELGNGIVGKYTVLKHEAERASAFVGVDLPCVVKVLNVEKISQKPESHRDLWFITMEKVKSLQGAELDLAHKMRRVPEYWDILMYDINNKYSEWEKAFPHLISFIQKHRQLTNCLRENNIHADDVHGLNLGYNNQGNLVLIDLEEVSYYPNAKIIPVQ